MPKNSPFETQVMQSYVDTHNVAAEASSAKLIRYLRQIYPGIPRDAAIPVTIADTDILVGTPEQTVDTDNPMQAVNADIPEQTALVGYLHTVIRHIEGLIKTSSESEAIALPLPATVELEHLAKIDATVRVVQLIAALPTFNHEDKLRIFQQMQSIAATCPGMRWDTKHMHWSQNKLYNLTTKSDDIVMASPAETLNLVCAAMLDNQRHVAFTAAARSSAAQASEQPIAAASSSAASSSVAPENMYIVDLACVLRELRREVEAGEREKCSGGQQHDMLFTLNRSFLGEQGKPIELAEDIQSFLLGAVSQFLELKMATLTDAEKDQLIRDWIQWGTAASPEDSPVIVWLRGQYPGSSSQLDVPWQKACREFLEQACKSFGINPKSCKIMAIVDYLPELTLPLVKGVMGSLVTELLRTKTIKTLIPTTLPINKLIELRNQALETFKQKVRFELLDEPTYAMVVSDFYTAESFFQALLRYPRPMTLVGHDDAIFNAAREALQEALQSYYNEYDLNRRLSTSFESSKATYLTQEKNFKAQSHIDVIRSFFAGVHDADTFDANWARLQQTLTASLGDVSAFLLSDANIQQWLSTNSTIDIGEERLVTEISADEVNHILLQAVLLVPEQWSPILKQTLLLITRWLSEPVSADDGASLQGLKRSYPIFFISNLRLIALLMTSENTDSQIYARCQAFCENRFNSFHTIALLDLFMQLTEAQSTQILTTVAHELPILIQDSFSLSWLFLLTPAQLNIEQRMIIWAAVRNKLSDLIQDGNTLRQLLAPSLEQLNLAQRADIWAAVENRLSDLIQDGTLLWQLFSLPPAKLSLQQRADIWAAVEHRLSDWIHNGALLCDDLLWRWFLLSPTQLSTVQRADFWVVVKNKLSDWIQDDSLLLQLLMLSPEQLSSEQRADLWTAIENQLPSLIQHDYILCQLLALPPEQLSLAQRADLWVAAKSKLSDLIQHGEGFCQLFSLTPEQLGLAQRADIWAAVEDTLSIWINNSDLFRRLMSLSPAQLGSQQRASLWTAVGNRLSNWIQEGNLPRQLFSLSIEQFSLAQRADVWAMMTPAQRTHIERTCPFAVLPPRLPEQPSASSSASSTQAPEVYLSSSRHSHFAPTTIANGNSAASTSTCAVPPVVLPCQTPALFSPLPPSAPLVSKNADQEHPAPAA